MQDLSTLSNDELFKLCKSSGISAGPITQSTRSVYEKKLLRHLNEVTDSSEKKPLEKPAEIQSPIVILKANLQQTTENSQVESPKFVKPSTPKAKPQQQPEQETYSEKPTRRSIAKTSTEERTFEVTVDKKDFQPTIIQTAIRTHREEMFDGLSDRSSPMRQKKSESPKKVVMPEFKLLKPQSQQPNQEVRAESTSTFTGPNIRKRTATVDRPSVLSDRSEFSAEQSNKIEKKSSGFFSFKKILLVLALTVIVYFLMMHMQSNPENPIEVL